MSFHRDPIPALDNAVDDVLWFCEAAATNLARLSFRSHTANFPGDEPWLSILPTLLHLNLSSYGWDFGRNEEPIGLRAPTGRRDTAHATELRSFTLNGPYLSGLLLPAMPCLRQLALSRVEGVSISQLLLSCRDTLEDLCIVGPQTDQDLPVRGRAPIKIILPKLRRIHVGGIYPVWTLTQDPHTDFTIEAPELDSASLGMEPVWEGRYKYKWSAAEAVNGPELTALLQTSPKLTTLVIDDIQSRLSSEDLVRCLESAGPLLRELRLTHHVEDHVLRHLPTAVPTLRDLYVEQTSDCVFKMVKSFKQLVSGANPSPFGSVGLTIYVRVSDDGGRRTVTRCEKTLRVAFLAYLAIRERGDDLDQFVSSEFERAVQPYVSAGAAADVVANGRAFLQHLQDDAGTEFEHDRNAVEELVAGIARWEIVDTGSDELRRFVDCWVERNAEEWFKQQTDGLTLKWVPWRWGLDG